MKKIFILLLFFSEKINAQNFGLELYTLPKQGSWYAEAGDFTCYNYYLLTISNDTLMLNTGICTTSHSRVLAKFKVVGNQIVAKSFVSIDVETNVGTLREYDKNSDYTFNINICEIFNKCSIDENSIFKNIKSYSNHENSPNFVEQKPSLIPSNFDEFAKKFKKF